VTKTVEELNSLFFDHKVNKTKYKRFVFAGPGPLKDKVAEHPKLLSAIKNKVLKVISVAYAFEAGLKEAIRKSESLLHDSQGFWKKQLLQKLFNQIAADTNCYTLGSTDTFEALESGCAETLLLAEDGKYKTVICEKSLVDIAEGKISSETEEKSVQTSVVFHTASQRDLRAKLKEIEEDKSLVVREITSFVDWAWENAEKEHGVKLVLLGCKTPLGVQFAKGFGGIAALTRYPFHSSAGYENTAQDDVEDSSSSSSDESDDDIADIFG